jgi:hypothetical protein
MIRQGMTSLAGRLLPTRPIAAHDLLAPRRPDLD